MQQVGNRRGQERRGIRKANSLLLALFLLAPAVYAQSGSSEVVAPENVTPEAAIPQGVAPQDQILPNATAEVEQWLGKLAQAVSELDYRGLVTFEHAGMLETLQVVHAVREGEQVERVRYLSGAPRELISHGNSKNCERTSGPMARVGLWSRAGQQDVQRAYLFILRGEERIADRDTVVIEARPRDNHRLGLVVNLDRETGLPLKTMLVGAQGRVLERYQFVQLDLSPVQDSELQPQSADARRIDNNNPCNTSQSRWQVSWLPDGFKPVSAKPLSDGDMLVFSDGLSVFTVFVQRLGPELDYRGRAIRGATVAYMDRLEVDGVNYTVTVVGEIPDATAQRVASAVTVDG
ncbi:sigma E regulatory protein, MucB/RseB [Microbulbifer donghaiensis]|uniref:Sigma E regulatory protein, MucB/RseB n=1 Tax=Microbulbifer donghaiensis TaxID=494016 RepID=A0A1M4WN93_9GAMM|nr:MucB/RseB C-terminal domain-containing protein [Microbulbifer donghaiensis]SHE82761.1 sigma E regulatory protein, MucB/RseB [Microbulbifer donghaiensis]